MSPQINNYNNSLYPPVVSETEVGPPCTTLHLQTYDTRPSLLKIAGTNDRSDQQFKGVRQFFSGWIAVANIIQVSQTQIFQNSLLKS